LAFSNRPIRTTQRIFEITTLLQKGEPGSLVVITPPIPERPARHRAPSLVDLLRITSSPEEPLRLGLACIDSTAFSVNEAQSRAGCPFASTTGFDENSSSSAGEKFARRKLAQIASTTEIFEGALGVIRLLKVKSQKETSASFALRTGLPEYRTTALWVGFHTDPGNEHCPELSARVGETQITASTKHRRSFSIIDGATESS
jgi:hypothetical protein